MIARAKRVFPGMVLSLLMSAPAFAAGNTNADTTQAGTRASVAAPQKPAKPTALPPQSGLPKAPVNATVRAPEKASVKALVKAPQKPLPKTVTKTVQATPVASEDRVVREVHGTDGLIEDGTLWREAGASVVWQQTGVASWYGGKRWQGHRMSSGVRYDENKLTAAHATLPIGTRVRVALHDGAQSVIVTIMDRPGTRTRIIDLSRKAAADLGILGRGVAMVTLTPL